MSNLDEWRYHWINFMRGVALVAIAWATVGLAPVAQAYSQRGCLSPEEGQLASYEAASSGGGPAQTGMYGVRSDVKILASDDCQIVDSVYIKNGSFGSMEVGYLSGWSNCSGYTSQFYATPVLFYWAVDTNNTLAGCQVFPTIHPTTGSYEEFRASNLNHNNYWNVYYNGEDKVLDGVHLSFTSGYGVVAQERGNVGDPGLGRFHEVQEAGNLNVWGRWDYGTEYIDSDSDFDNSWQNGYTNNIS